MVDANVVAEKLKHLSFRLEKIRARCPADPEGFAADGDLLDLLAFNLQIAVQTCLDLATHLISDAGWAPAATSREAFERLEAHGVISRQTVQALRQAVSLRNFVAHDYAGVDPARIHAAAKTGLSDLERFAGEVSAWVAGQLS